MFFLAFAASWLAFPAALFLGYFLYVAPLEEKALSEGALGVARDVDALLAGKAVVVEGALGQTDVEKFREPELLDKLLRRILKRTPDFLSLELIDPEGVIVARLGEFNLSEEGLPSHVNVAKFGALDSLPDHKRRLFKDEPRLNSFYLITRKSAKEGASFYYLRFRFSRESLASTLKRAELRGLPTSLSEFDWEPATTAVGTAGDGDGKNSAHVLAPAGTRRVTVVRSSRFAHAFAEVPLEALGWRITVGATDLGGPSTFTLVTVGLLGLLPLAMAGIGALRSGPTAQAEPMAAFASAPIPTEAPDDYEQPVNTPDVEEKTPNLVEETEPAPVECERKMAVPQAQVQARDPDVDNLPMNENAAALAPSAAQGEVDPVDHAAQESQAPAPTPSCEEPLHEASSTADSIEVAEPTPRPASTPITALATPCHTDEPPDERAERETVAEVSAPAPVDASEKSPTVDCTERPHPQSGAFDEPPPDLPWFEVVVEPDRRRHAEASPCFEKRAETGENEFPEYLEVDLGVEDACDPASGEWEKARTKTFHRLRRFLSAQGAG
jgi:hypothetical protein